MESFTSVGFEYIDITCLISLAYARAMEIQVREDPELSLSSHLLVFDTRVGCPVFRFFWSSASGIEIGIPDRSNNDQEKTFPKKFPWEDYCPGGQSRRKMHSR